MEMSGQIHHALAALLLPTVKDRSTHQKLQAI
jgi:hypothetical protein